MIARELPCITSQERLFAEHYHATISTEMQMRLGQYRIGLACLMVWYFDYCMMPPSARLAAIRILKFTGCNCASLICQTPMMICIRCPLPLGYKLPCFCVFAQSIRRCLFALGVVVLHFVEFSRPDRLPGVSTNAILQTSRPHTSLCWSLMFFLKCSESGPLLGPSCLPSFAVAEPTDER